MVCIYADGASIFLLKSIIYGYFEMAAKEGDIMGLKGMIAG
jgi:hypothetical protein